MKIFFVSTHPNQGTGYGRIANKITNHLASLSNVEVVCYAFQNYPGQNIQDRFIDPRITFYDALVEDPAAPKGFGDAGIVPVIQKEKPDVLFMYNDLPVCGCILDLIPKEDIPPKVMLYLDVVYPWEHERFYSKIRGVDHVFTFLECWKKHLIDDIGFDPKKVSVLRHGVDLIPELDRDACREKLKFEPDDFVILNLNRNSYRKQWSVTIAAFIDFVISQNMNPKLKLFCGCMLTTDDGYDIVELIHCECKKRKISMDTIVNKHIFITTKPLHMSELEIHELYNACDMGLNTCCGEGFGLTTMEHATLNKPQVISGVPALLETLGEFSHVVEPKLWTTMSNFESHSGDIALFDYKDFSKQIECCYKSRFVPLTREHIEKEYNWENTYKHLDHVLFNGAV